MSDVATAATPASALPLLTLALFVSLLILRDPEILALALFHAAWFTLAVIALVVLADAIACRCGRLGRGWQVGANWTQRRQLRPEAVPLAGAALSRLS